MSDESYSFSTARARLEEIVTQVRKKDTSLEKSLDLLEEGVRLANTCTELIDHADWTVGGVVDPASGDGETAESSENEAVGETPGSGDLSEAQGSDDAGDGDAENGAPAENAAPAGDDEFAPDDDAFGDAADEAWSDDTPEYRDDEA